MFKYAIFIYNVTFFFRVFRGGRNAIKYSLLIDSIWFYSFRIDSLNKKQAIENQTYRALIDVAFVLSP